VPKFDYEAVLKWGSGLGVAGLVFCVWYFREEDSQAYYRCKVWAIWGLVIGAAVSLAWQWLAGLRRTGNDPMRAALENKREMLRHMQMMISQRHAEFIYHDASREHSRLYGLCCCPPYSKITSGRAVWSEPDPKCCAGEHEGVCGWPGAVVGWFLGQYCRRVETVPFDHIDDVTMTEGVLDKMRGTATLTMRVSGAKQQRHLGGEREDLINALNMDEAGDGSSGDILKRVALKKALLSLRHADKRGIEAEIQASKEKIEELERASVSAAGDEEHQAEARKDLRREDADLDLAMGEGRRWEGSGARGDGGTAVEMDELIGTDCYGNQIPSASPWGEAKPGQRTLSVPMVVNPYTVLDDLSYRCTRDMQGAAW